MNRIKVLITGANGFIGRNLIVKLNEIRDYKVTTFLRTDSYHDLHIKVVAADVIIHLAGVNRPKNNDEFRKDNLELTDEISKILSSKKLKTPVIFSSSVQATHDNPYGNSKFDAENILKDLNKINGNPVLVYRLPGVFGKWCKPNYNSVVATFCHNILNNIPIYIADENKNLVLVHIEDVVESFLDDCKNNHEGVKYAQIENQYEITIGDLADKIKSFYNSRFSLINERVGVGFTRALYSTYLTYLSPEDFAYSIPSYDDERGSFVEMLKTKDSGQFSFFTAKPGITRGGHYHHVKTEKFLVIKGNAKFNFQHIIGDETYSLETSGDEPVIVETVPGWSHDITNIGSDDLIVMLWANEIFNKDRPDTIPKEVNFEKT